MIYLIFQPSETDDSRFIGNNMAALFQLSLTKNSFVNLLLNLYYS
jgi:hypothetical protein